MAKLNFPDPNVTKTYTEAGITWTWNDALNVWSSASEAGFNENVADERYLRIDADAPDQTRVAGNTVFSNHLRVSPQSDAWNTSTKIVIPECGSLSSEGSNNIHITAGGYRNNNNQWSKLGTIKSGGAQLVVDGNGIFQIMLDANKAAGSSFNPTERVKITQSEATFNVPIIGNLTGNASTATSATTATNADAIKRTGIASTSTSNYRVLLGPTNNNTGYSTAYVVTDRTDLYYQPSSRTLHGLTKVNAEASTVKNGVYTTGNQTIGGTKTFSNDIITGAMTIATTTISNTGNYINFSTPQATIRVSGGGFYSAYLNISHNNTWSGISISSTTGTTVANCKYGLKHDNNSPIKIQNTAGYAGLETGGQWTCSGNVELNQDLISSKDTSAMRFRSKNGTYNFRNSGNSANSGTINAGNVLFRNLSRITGDENDPANFNAEGDYIGPVENLLSIIQSLETRLNNAGIA